MNLQPPLTARCPFDDLLLTVEANRNKLTRRWKIRSAIPSVAWKLGSSVCAVRSKKLSPAGTSIQLRTCPREVGPEVEQ